MASNENAILISKFVSYYSSFKNCIQDYTLKEVLDRAFVLPPKIECNEKMIRIVQDLIERRGLKLKVKDVTKKLSKAGLLNEDGNAHTIGGGKYEKQFSICKTK